MFFTGTKCFAGSFLVPQTHIAFVLEDNLSVIVIVVKDKYDNSRSMHYC
jgi:hypothetical protein